MTKSDQLGHLDVPGSTEARHLVYSTPTLLCLFFHTSTQSYKSKMIATTESIRSIAQLQSPYQVQEEVKRYLNTEFNDLDSLLLPSTGAGPSRKKRKTLDQEIEYYEKLESDAAKEVCLLLHLFFRSRECALINS